VRPMLSSSWKRSRAASGELRKHAARLQPGSETTEPAGYILPIRRRQPEGQLRWSSQLWFPRPERLLLSAGDSPIGFRIPTESMPWVAPDEIEYEFDAAPFADRVKLPARPRAAWNSSR
jgi:uncharacterized protein (DUF2126 family)